MLWRAVRHRGHSHSIPQNGKPSNQPEFPGDSYRHPGIRATSISRKRLQETLHAWADKNPCTRRELESLLGHLSHGASVISQGRTFLWQLFPLLSLDRASNHYIRLNAGARTDLTWWRVFLQDRNGASFFPTTSTAAEVPSDASGA